MPVQQIWDKLRQKAAADAPPPVIQPSLMQSLGDTFKSYMSQKTGPTPAPEPVKPIEVAKVPEIKPVAPATSIEPGIEKSIPKPEPPVVPPAAPEPEAPKEPVAPPAVTPAPSPAAPVPPTPVAQAKPHPLTSMVADPVNRLTKNVMDEVQQNPQKFGVTDWLTSNWGNIAVPAGILLSMFGGRTGAILGGLAMAAGGYNLYNRYQTLMSKEAQPELQKYIGSKFDPKVLAEIQQTNPALGQAATDLRGAIHYGFVTDVLKHIQQGGEEAIKTNPLLQNGIALMNGHIGRLSPEEQQQFIQSYRNQTNVDTSKLPGTSTWGSTSKDYVSGLYDKGKNWVQARMQ